MQTGIRFLLSPRHCGNLFPISDSTLREFDSRLGLADVWNEIPDSGGRDGGMRFPIQSIRMVE